MDKPKKLSLEEIRKVLADNRRARRTAESATFDENTRRIVLAALDFQFTILLSEMHRRLLGGPGRRVEPKHWVDAHVVKALMERESKSLDGAVWEAIGKDAPESYFENVRNTYFQVRRGEGPGVNPSLIEKALLRLEQQNK